MNIFNNHRTKEQLVYTDRKDFSFVSDSDVYLDSACQSLRPQPVLDAMFSYFQKYNACGGRVKYEWGKQVDEAVEKARVSILKRLGKSPKEYGVAFTLNTTYGLNLILNQLPGRIYKQIVTSEIEHNSVFLPTMMLVKKLGIPRVVLKREQDGSLNYTKENVAQAVIVVNATSNIDGRTLRNAKVLANDTHKAGGILIVDGAQSLVHDTSLLREVDFDALCFSGHKTYGPSLGVVVIKKTLLELLELSFVGGGMVEKLETDSFSIPIIDPVSKLEPGLQDFAGIIGLSSALDWLDMYKPEGLSVVEHTQRLAQMTFDGLSSIEGLHLLNSEPSSTISFYSENVDAHRLAIFLSQQHIMTRSGYFCCHYYLQNVKKYPPLLRVSLGLHNTESDIRKFLEVTQKIISNIK